MFGRPITLCLCFACIACTAPASTPPPSLAGTSEHEARVASALSDPRRFACTTDADCTNSCMHGAVSASWFAGVSVLPGFPECMDGCRNQISAPPRCEREECVAYQVDPHDAARVTRRESCTHVSLL